MIANGLKFKGYKSFSHDYQSIDNFSKINVFIGRNNSGKSSCLDLIEYLTDPSVSKINPNITNSLDLQITYFLDDSDIRSVFHEGTSGGGINGNHYAFGKNYSGKMMTFSVSSYQTDSIGVSDKFRFSYNYVPEPGIFPDNYSYYWKEFSKSKHYNSFEKYIFRRINAERDITAEAENESAYLGASGEGASNLIREFINNSEYDEKIIEITLLTALNRIVFPDSHFSGIRIQQVKSDSGLLWEIFLQEGDARYALSKMGSGLKTIILVLLNLIVVPELRDYDSKPIIFAFEELENNLHPALQRRLFDYLYEYSVENDSIIFLTTHSHVAINVFSDNEDTQIFHVTKEDGNSSFYKIDDYISKSSLLNDLDVRASDLLQSNGVIWVEGPSDRIYIKKWIEIFSDVSLIEGRDYQFLYYGGRLLSHFTVDQQENLISILLTNRNAAIVIDSDKRNKQETINSTKKRIKDEFKKYDMECWITKGKEIENYVAKDAIEKMLGKSIKCQCMQYELFPDYIKNLFPNFTGSKVNFAHMLSEFITFENSRDILDLQKQINKICIAIKGWNSL